MKRTIVAVLLLVSAFAICFIGYFSVDRVCKVLEAELEKICIASRNDETEKAIELSDSTVSKWEQVHGLIESFIRHEETDTLEEIIKSLPVYAGQGNLERLEQQADLGIDELHHLIRSEKPLISNIF